eukprot:jgi/Mesen1/7343/ME000377S06560
MNRNQPVCRDFLRGSCKYGARCKFSHQLPQQQQQQGQGQQSRGSQFGQQSRQQQFRGQYDGRGGGGGGGGTGNRFGPLAGGGGGGASGHGPARQQGASAPAAAPKDHRCGDARQCQEQIQQDMLNERPSTWLASAYAHWKYLNNDVAGDVSFEEARAEAYVAAQQGIPLANIVQRERALLSERTALFDALASRPYRPPAAAAAAAAPSPFGTSLPTMASSQSPPAAAPPGATMLFGKLVAPAGPASAPFGAPALAFGATAAPTVFGTPSSAFGSSAPPPLSPSPFGSNAGGSPFGAPASSFPAVQQLAQPASLGFGGTGGATVFGAQAGNPSFGSSSPFGFGAQGPPTSVFGRQAGSSPVASFGVPAGNTALTFGSVAPHNAAAGGSLFGAAPASHAFANSFGQVASAAAAGGKVEGVEDVWLHPKWVLGQIPEAEPPVQIRT